MGREPEWLAQVRSFCKTSNIKIMAWGAETVVVEARDDAQAKKAATELRSFGFEPIEDESDAEAGMLLLSRDRAGTLAKMKKR